MKRHLANVRMLELATIFLIYAGLCHAQNLKADYQFQGNYNSSVAGAPAMTNLTCGAGSNAFATDLIDGYTRQTLRFPFNCGLNLNVSGFIPTNTYTIVGLFRLDDVSGYRRLAGSDPNVDAGAYVQDGRLEFEATTNTAFRPGHYIQVAYVREASGLVRAYRDGTLRASVTDSGGVFIITTGMLRFFQDDILSPTEASAGNVARLRLYDGALSTTQIRALDRVANATGSGDQNLLFNSGRDGFQEIYTMNPDGSNQKRLTNNEVADFNAKWSPDRSKIVFIHQVNSISQIWIMNADGSGQTQLTSTGIESHAPSWRPDGQKILYSVCDSNFVCDLYTMDPNGANQTPFPLINTANDEDQGVFSPNGLQVAFGCTSFGANFFDGNICVANADGSGRHSVTNTFSPIANSSPVFSPNSAQIAFTRYSSETDALTAEIYRINSDGIGLTSLTNNSFFDSLASWSPDGQRIVFNSPREGAFNEIYTINASDGGSLQRLTVNSVADAYPDWYRPAGVTLTPTPTSTATVTLTPTSTPTPTLTATICATPGTLDLSFNGTGTIITPIGETDDVGNSVAIQTDGKIVVAGHSKTGSSSNFALARYNVDGMLDKSFNGTGTVITDVGSPSVADNQGFAVAIQLDGKIVVAGYIYAPNASDFVIVRYNGDGSLDASFGGTGKVITDVGGDDLAFAISIQTDGRIIAVGRSRIGSNEDFAVVRYNSNGTLDTSFNGTGKVITPIGSANDEALSVTIQPDARILVAGYSYVNGSTDFAAVRYNIDGTLDTSFNGTGMVTTPIGSSGDEAHSASLQPDGRIVLAGASRNASNNTDFAVIRYNGDGTLDTSFNGTGKVTTPIGSANDGANAVVIQPDGKIIAAGFAAFGSGSDFALVRYNPSGTLDISFNATGRVTTSISPFIDYGTSAAVTSDGKIVVAGFSGSETHYDFAVARYNGAGCSTSTPTETPSVTPTPTSTRTVTSTPTATATPSGRAAFDYDGDRKSDVSVFRPVNGAWYLQESLAGFYGTLFGVSTDKITPADFDGDGKTDIAVYRPSTGIWYVYNSSSGTVSYYVFGLSDDLPTPADYDGDGKADVSVFRPSTGTWYRQDSSNGAFHGTQFGASEDKPTVGDFDGDGKADIAVFRPSSGAWYRINSGNGSIYGELFGFGTDVITPADYDGDGKTDLAVFRPSIGIWYLKYSSNSDYDYKVFGLAADIPAAGDFDGDGKADICVFRPSDGNWYRQNSSNGAFIAFQFGASGDKPTQTAFRY